MASSSAARLAGDDYQHVYAWAEALLLLNPKSDVRAVTIEDGDAGSADDVTVLHLPDSPNPDRYHQVKYHVDHRETYSEETLLKTKGDGRSLLQKWFDSWEQIRALRPGHAVEVHIISTWTPSPELGALLSSQGNTLKAEFLTAPAATSTGAYRVRWTRHVGATEERFTEFARALRIRLAYCCQQEVEDKAAERMDRFGLRSDPAALLVAAGLVRSWVKAGRREINRADLEAVIDANGLRLPAGEIAGVAVHLVTIKAQAYEVSPDHLLDWRPYFTGPENKRGHELINPADWNGKLLKELEALEARINSEGPTRHIRARGQARLSAWIAFGFVFADVSRYTIEVDQQGQKWITTAPRSADFTVTTNGPDGETTGEPADVVAVGVSVTGPIEADVRKHLSSGTEKAGAMLFVTPSRPLGRECLRNASDAVALADGAKEVIREFVKRRQATRLLLYYFGPLAGACFLGHRLNAVCREIVVMERAEPTYTRSFVLT